MDSRVPILNTTAEMFNCLYARKFKMGVGKEDRGRVGSAGILCWITQLLDQPVSNKEDQKQKKGQRTNSRVLEANEASIP